MPESSIVEEARALLPLIRDERPEGDQRARLTKNVVEACGRAGLCSSRPSGATCRRG